MKFTRSRAFTLLELVVVIAIIGLLASLVLIPNLVRFQKRAAASRAKADITQVSTALALAASEGCTSITTQSGAALSCQGVTYLQRVPTASGAITYFCGTVDPAATNLTTGCTFNPGSFHQLRITGFTLGEFKCSEGSCFCTDTTENGCRQSN